LSNFHSTSIQRHIFALSMPKTESAAVAALAKARAAFSAYKGHFTRALKTFDRQVALVLAAEPTAQAVAALETSHDTFVTRYNKASAALDDLIDATIAAEEDDSHTSTSVTPSTTSIPRLKRSTWTQPRAFPAAYAAPRLLLPPP
jgi:hypothetical protein